MPRPETRPIGCVLQLSVQIEGFSSKVLALFDGGAEVPMMSTRLYEQLDPKPELRTATENIKGIYGPLRNPVGECTIKVSIPDLAVVVEYDVVVDNIDEDLLVDATMMHYAGVQLRYDTQELVRKDKVVKGIARVSRSEFCARRLVLKSDWLIQPRSRQLVPGQVVGVNKRLPHSWLVEQGNLLAQRESLLIARTLCRQEQAEGIVPVEVYNPTDEPVHLFRKTTLGIVTPIEEITNVKLETTDTTKFDSVSHVKTGKTESQADLPEDIQKLVDETKDVLVTDDVLKFENLVKEYRDVFSTKDEPLGQTDVVEHEIKTTGPPIKLQYRRVPPGLKEEAVKEEERMKQMGVVEPSESPWAAPVVLVRKKDGTLRYCIDYRKLNQVTQKDSYPLPNIQDCLDSLEGAKFFSSVDLSSGYWQVKMSEDAKDKTSFYGAGGGLWRFKVMPFGLCNAPATFERLMERVLGQLRWQICLCYLDDILIFSGSVDEHLVHLQTVFQRLREAKLKLKPKKCHFFQKQVTFLGHIVSAEGIMTDPSKVLKIAECPAPQDVHEVRSVLGLFSYYRRFMPHFSELAKPLIKLTEKNRVFSWGREQQDAFDQLKQLLEQAPVLAHPRKEGSFILDTDASNEGIGAVLSQVQDDEEKVIAFASKTLSKTERNYCITRRELLAVVYFTEQFKHFLLGRPFLIRTDNSAVRYWMRLQSNSYDPQGQTARWMIKLAAFDFEIKHRSGKQHGNADSMSRMPFLKCAQCELRHRGAFETKRPKKTTDSISHSQTQQRPCDKGDDRKQSFLHSGGKDCDEARMNQDVSVGSQKDLDSSGSGSQRNQRRQASKARVMTRSQVPQGPKASHGTPPSWLKGGVCLDEDVLRDEQLRDPACVDAFCWIKNGSRPEKEEILSSSFDTKFLWGNFDCLVIENGLLCKRIGPLVDGTTRVTIYVPPILRRKVIEQCHDTKTSGHFYFWKTVNKVKRYFTWGGLSKEVQIYCKACHICATRKTAGRKQKASMRRYDVGSPMEEIAIDLMGPFPESDSGNKYVLVVVDSFSKWMEAYAIPNIEAKTVAERLVLEFISRFGVPMQIKSDRGRQFECELFREMCLLLDVSHKMSTPFHPQGNSRVERMVKVVGNLISVFCETYKEWDKNLPLLTFAYRSTVHEVTGFTPNFVMTGREISLPLDVMLGTMNQTERKSVPEYVQTLQTRLQDCFVEVRKNLKQFGERQRKYYNLSAHGDKFKPGDLVYLREKTRKKQVSPKLMPKWKGPYLVIKRFGTVYEVMTAFKVTKLFHFDLLKPCFTTDFPKWIKKARKRFLPEQAGTIACENKRVEKNARGNLSVWSTANQRRERHSEHVQTCSAWSAQGIKAVRSAIPHRWSQRDENDNVSSTVLARRGRAGDDDDSRSGSRQVKPASSRRQGDRGQVKPASSQRQDDRGQVKPASARRQFYSGQVKPAGSRRQDDSMPLQGVNGRLYTWCVVCKNTVPDRHKTLRIHLNKSHRMELLPGCQDCFYYRSRWADVRKHCFRLHNKDINSEGSDNVLWGLAQLDESKPNPTYSTLTEDAVCVYPLKGEAFTPLQIQVVARAQFLEATTQDSSHSSHSRPSRASRTDPPEVKSRRVKSHSKKPTNVSSKSQSPTRKVSSRSSSPPVSRARKPAAPKQRVPAAATRFSPRLQSPSARFSPQQLLTVRDSPQQSASTRSSPARFTPLQAHLDSGESSVTPEVTPVKTTGDSLHQPTTSTPEKVARDFVPPDTPCRSLESSFNTSQGSRGSRSSRRSTRQRSLEEVVQDLTSSVGTMETVPSLSSPPPLHIPVLDPSVSEIETSSVAESPQRSSRHSSRHTIDVIVAGTEPVDTTTVTVEDDSQTTTAVELIDPATLPSNVNISLPRVSVMTQTDLHINQDDTVLVVPGGGGRLLLQ